MSYSLADLISLQIKQEMNAEQMIIETYDKIEKYNHQFNIFRSLLPKKVALEQAHQIDQKLKQGQSVGRLAGIPISIKENICIESSILKTSCGSKMLENYSSPYSATIVTQLLQEDAILIGTTNMDEFAMGSSTENSAFGQTRNPWKPSHVPGGSSGGAAVSVATDIVPLAIGSDTGGSIRQPASFCGVTGFKPSYGAVSRYGLVAYGSSLDQIGPIAKTAKDCADAFSMMQGYDSKDATSAQINWSNQPTQQKLSEKKIGVLKEFLEHPAIHEDVQKSIMEMIEFLKSKKVTVEMCSLFSQEYIIPTYYILAFAEASSNLSRFDGIRYGLRKGEKESLADLFVQSRSQGLGAEVKRRIMLGNFVLSSGYYDQYYGKANQVRKMIDQEVQNLLNQYDCLLAPVTPTPAFKIGEKSNDPLSMYLEDLCSVLPNLTGNPSISIPGKLSKNHLPIGIQFIGKKFQDWDLLAIAQAIQEETEYHQTHKNVL